MNKELVCKALEKGYLLSPSFLFLPLDLTFLEQFSQVFQGKQPLVFQKEFLSFKEPFPSLDWHAFETAKVLSEKHVDHKPYELFKQRFELQKSTSSLVRGSVRVLDLYEDDFKKRSVEDFVG